MPNLRIAIVEDHLLIRKSMIMLVNSFKGMEVVLDADNGQSFLEQLQHGNPFDVVLLDIQMPVMNGFEVCKYLLNFHRDVKILVVSQLTAKQTLHKVIEMGAHGYFTKNSAPEQLETAIRYVCENGYYFQSDLNDVLQDVLFLERKKAKTEIISENKLTDRELQIITLMCKEMASHEIAAQLFISVRSVEAHRRSIMEKTYSHNVIGIVLYALRRKLISLDGFNAMFPLFFLPLAL